MLILDHRAAVSSLVGLSFFHHEAGEFSFVGAANFVDILRSRGYRVTEPLSFYFTLGVTVLWTDW